ncbi:MAG: hypothetical protein DLD55_04050 [candidate division SR1 bacterium]|nr:MAG: hypothetical protein DLD55_04050 [candidate division SR1 bacterium]
MLTRLRALSLYTKASLVKVVFGLVVLGITLFTLNVKEDPEISLSLLLIGLFIFAWGVSYFLFYGGQVLVLIRVSQEKMQKDAYKSSFLFGLYALINVLLLILNSWEKWIGILFLFIFIAMQWVVFTDKKHKNNDY